MQKRNWVNILTQFFLLHFRKYSGSLFPAFVNDIYSCLLKTRVLKISKYTDSLFTQNILYNLYNKPWFLEPRNFWFRLFFVLFLTASCKLKVLVTTICCSAWLFCCPAFSSFDWFCYILISFCIIWYILMFLIGIKWNKMEYIGIKWNEME